jgi:uncharacterized protein (TIGR03437 family)
VKTILAIVLSVGLFAASGSAQPKIDHISNAASYTLSPLPNSSIAQGSFFVIFGNGLASSTASIWGDYPLPTELGNASVAVTVGGQTKNAIIFYAGPSAPPFDSQINAVLPSDTPTGTGQVVVTYNGQASAAKPITVVSSSFGTFTVNQGGTGPGWFFNIANDGSAAQNTPLNAAKPGQMITVFGTGLGPVSDVANEGKQPPATGDMRSSSFLVDVYVGNQKADVAYAGRSGYTAEDQVNFTVPSGVQGCYVNVAIYAGPPGNQVISNFSSLAVNPNGGPCSDGDGIDMADIATQVQNNGSANVGVISMLSNYLNITGVLSVRWDNDTVTGEIGNFTSATLNAFQGFTLAPSVDTCTVSPFQGFPPATDPALAQVTFLDAGASLSIQGPNGTKPVPKNSNNNGYGGLVGGATIQELLQAGGEPPFFLDANFKISAGTYTVSAPGGSKVGAFSGTLNVSSAAAQFNWTNSNIASNPIPRNQDLTITWTGGDPNGFVDITLIGSTNQSGVPTATTPGVLVACMAKASDGSFTVPSFVLQSLPSTTGSSSLIPPGEILVGPASGGVKISPTPSGLDAAYLFYHFIAGTTASWQ